MKMKKILKEIPSLLVLVLTVLVLALVSAQPKSASAANLGKEVGSVSMIRGDVLIDEKPAKNGDAVRENSIVETKNNSVVTLLLGKGTALFMGAQSKMVVNKFGATPAGGEQGSLDLKFGRTRALMMNKGNKNDLKIKARAATMGVRGTEVYIQNPVNDQQPVSFFTLEGEAVVMDGQSAPQPLLQGQGFTTTATSTSTTSNASAPQAISVESVREQVKQEGLAPPPALHLADVSSMKVNQGLASNETISSPTYGNMPGALNDSNGVFTDILTTESRNETLPALGAKFNTSIRIQFCGYTGNCN